MLSSWEIRDGGASRFSCPQHKWNFLAMLLLPYQSLLIENLANWGKKSASQSTRYYNLLSLLFVSSGRCLMLSREQLASRTLCQRVKLGVLLVFQLFSSMCHSIRSPAWLCWDLPEHLLFVLILLNITFL
ncbi:hypothetical protein AV530_004314 [Patagioenas fasciata monilis]|uniref:Uncharacterized protein n=1 Tax=Patagioenas fasciata monilis TaxID=372326 RepID=A0A1V4K900_PATFA|nr:hypothetical protein AV530_004314 [Patagioenas fasciata monilis]